MARAISAFSAADPLVDEAAGCRRIAERVGCGDGPRRSRRVILAARMDEAERPVRSRLVADAGELRQADGMVDRVLGARAAAAERHHGETERARVDGGDRAGLGMRNAASRPARWADARRAAARRSAGPPSALTIF